MLFTELDTVYSLKSPGNIIVLCASFRRPLRAGRSGFDSRQGVGIFLFAPRLDRLWSPPILLYKGSLMFFPQG